MAKQTDERDQFNVAARVRQRERPTSQAMTKDRHHLGEGPLAQVPTTAKASEYEVGYGRPPKHSQFQPGQSGNPNGRPKGAKSPFTLLREELQRKVTLRENGTVTTVTKLEAIMKRVVADTLGGKASQTKLLFALLHVFETQDATVPDDRNLSHADEELLRNLLKGFSDE